MSDVSGEYASIFCITFLFTIYLLKLNALNKFETAETLNNILFC